MKTNILIIIFVLALNVAFSQEKNKCKVLKPEISEKYTGECKKGLAHGKGKAEGKETYEGKFKKGLPHGKGVYTYQDGSVYNGQWKKGKRAGMGKYTFAIAGKDSVQDGRWDDDKYLGPPESQTYKINFKKGIERIVVRRMANTPKKVELKFFQGGAPNGSISNFFITGNNGLQLSSGYGYENLEFPFECAVKYKTSNKMQTRQFECELKFTLLYPGSYEINISN